MKKIFFIFLFSIINLVSFSQAYFKAVTTELYDYNSTTKEWNLNTKNSNVDIIIVVEEEFLTIQAKSPTMYKIFNNSRKEVKTKNVVGFRYDARDLRSDNSVVIDIVRLSDNSASLISVINLNEEYNMRFYIEPVKN